MVDVYVRYSQINRHKFNTLESWVYGGRQPSSQGNAEVYMCVLILESISCKLIHFKTCIKHFAACVEH